MRGTRTSRMREAQGSLPQGGTTVVRPTRTSPGHAARAAYRRTTGDGTRIAVPSFFGKREEEKPGASRGKEGLNEQGYDPYDAKAIDSSSLDTKPVYIALAVATVVIGALSVSNSVF